MDWEPISELSDVVRKGHDELWVRLGRLQEEATILSLRMMLDLARAIEYNRSSIEGYSPNISKNCIENFRRTLNAYLASDMNSPLMEMFPNPFEVVKAYRYLESCYRETNPFIPLDVKATGF